MTDQATARSGSWPGLDGRTALVTGASSGLGAHFAQLLASHGVTVTAAARRVDKLAALGAGIEPLALDVIDSRAVAQALAGRTFDIVLNNAGVTLSAAALDHDEAAVDRIIDTNLKGAFNVARAVVPGMRTAGRGSIVNIASILGLRVAGHVSAYAASKAGLVQLTKALALEWARYGIRVNALCPGYIETPLNAAFFASEAGQALVRRIPQRRLGQMRDLDAPLLLLASDAGAYMTGAVLAVDGGHLVSSL